MPEPDAHPAADPAADLEARLDDLVAVALERLESEGEPGLERLLRDHQDLAARVRSRVDALRGGGLLDPPTRPEAIKIPERLGEFRLVRCLGSGGMGVVYLAEQERPRRLVALKMLLPAHLFFPHARERFRREVEIVARMNHPGIVPIYTVGEDEGLPYFVMERVDGVSLAEILRGAHGRDPADLTGADLRALVRELVARNDAAVPQLGVTTSTEETLDDVFAARVFSGSWADASLRLLEQVAAALAHAHARNVLHRDVKPSNIMVRADGRAQLVDFGLALLQGSSKITRSGANPGSLPYMAPEQLDEGRGGLDARTDVYALGVTLYEMLTLRSAFDSRSREVTTRRILDGDLVPIRAIHPRIPRDVATVCEMAMAAEARRRYATAADCARDLEAARDRRPVAAKPPSLVWSALRKVRRHRVRALAVAAILLAVGTFVATYLSEHFFADQALSLKAGRDLALDATRRVMVAIQDGRAPRPEDLALLESEIEDPQFEKNWEFLAHAPFDPKVRTELAALLRPPPIAPDREVHLLQPLAGTTDRTPNFIFDVPPANGRAHRWEVVVSKDGAPFHSLLAAQAADDPGPMRIEFGDPGLDAGVYTWHVRRDEAAAGDGVELPFVSNTAEFEVVDLARMQPLLDRVAELRETDPGLVNVTKLMTAATYLRFRCACQALQELADFPPDAPPENHSYRLLLEAHAQSIELAAETAGAKLPADPKPPPKN